MLSSVLVGALWLVVADSLTSGSRKRMIRELAENTYIVETTYGKVIKSRLASIKLINMPYRTTPLCSTKIKNYSHLWILANLARL